MQDRRSARLVAYAVAILAPSASLLVRWLLWPVMRDAVPHMAFFPAVMLAAYFGGLWPGIVATILSAIAANYFLTGQLRTFHVTGINDLAGLILFLLTGAIISGLCESLHRAQRRIIDEERRRAEVTLRETEERFSQIAENIHEIFWVADLGHTRILYVSPGYDEVWGRTSQSLYDQPRSWIESIHPDDRAAVTENLEQRSRGVFNDLEFRIVRSDGELRWIRARAFPINDPAGNLSRVAGLAEDITERKQAEEETRQAKDRLELAVRGSHVSVWEFSMADGLIENSRQTLTNFWELLGCDPLTAPTDFASVLKVSVHPDDQERVLRTTKAFLEGNGEEFETEHRGRLKDGSIGWRLARGVALRNADGKPIRFIGTTTDITHQKRAEESLRESEQRFRSTFENAAVGIGHVNFEGRWLRVNQKLCEIVGYAREELLGKTFQEITLADDLSDSLEQFAQLWRGDVRSYSLEKRYVRKDGSPVWIETTVSLQRGADGAPKYTIAIIQDISERKRLEEELRHAKDVAEAANRAKDEFLANVSHEIRTPMNAIIGMTELVLDSPLPDDQRQSLRTVKSAADNLLGIINDLLDFSKIEAGKLELDRGDFSLRTVVGDTLRALAVRAHRKGIELVCNVQAGAPDALIGDPGRLRQVLLNIIGNAIKFTERGEVVVQVDAVSDSASNGTVGMRFSVRDTGIGIPRDKLSTIFRAFEQEDMSTTRKYGGTGLGLTISAQLVALMGGSISVESESGRGSIFSFSAQFTPQAHQPAEVSAPPPILLRNLRVLVVDDNAVNLRIMETWLRAWGMQPTCVEGAMAAMDALWHGVAVGKPHALILLDARMPDTDGLTLAAKIRERAELSASRIILLSSGDHPGDFARFRELRVDGHLLKPVQQDELLEMIYAIINRTSGEAPAVRPLVTAISNPAALPAIAPLRILVAEDSEFNAQLMEKLLAKRGHAVRIVGNGREAVDVASAAEFDLLFLDVHMPELDGFEAIRLIRQREQTTGLHLPVVALTARSRKEDREHCLAAGMDGFLAKPIRANDLWTTIDHVLTEFPPANRNGTGLLDAKVLLAACGDDESILRSICEGLRASLPSHLAAIGDALGAGDAPRLRETAHKLCGMVAAFSTVAGSLASELEECSARGQLEEARPLALQLQTVGEELMKQLDDDLDIESLRHRRDAMPS